ncbi:MAG: family 78 glycoside hydrolase catalytic domain, partial [Bacteroidales bacterium]|nr:family 78 glycoside hydrolase catalytic domain [Bacteroidales bacterium]
MKFIAILPVMLLSLLPLSSFAKKSQPQKLTVENMTNPIGVDEKAPRFKWQLNDDRHGAAQQAFRIRVGSDSAAVARGKGGFWDTGVVRGDQMQMVFDGKKSLQPFTRYYWSVQSWDQNGKKGRISPVASFETGMIDQSNWLGQWIADTNDINFKPAPYFRKTFKTAGPVKSARAYISAAGLFELSINGQTVSDHRLDPLYTRFDKRNLYITHDVTSLIQQKEVAIGVVLGNGWYNHQSTAVWNFDKAHWRNRPRFIMNLRIVYENGKVETISSGPEWKTSTGPIIFNSIYTAEHYDARLEQKGWNTPDFNDAKWTAVRTVPAASENIVSQCVEPIRAIETIPAVSIRKAGDNIWIYDLGRNIAGVSKITVSGPAGTVIRLKHAELLDSLGMADQSNINVHYRPVGDSDPFQTDIFILSGKGQETFMP